MMTKIYFTLMVLASLNAAADGTSVGIPNRTGSDPVDVTKAATEHGLSCDNASTNLKQIYAADSTELEKYGGSAVAKKVQQDEGAQICGVAAISAKCTKDAAKIGTCFSSELETLGAKPGLKGTELIAILSEFTNSITSPDNKASKTEKMVDTIAFFSQHKALYKKVKYDYSGDTAADKVLAAQINSTYDGIVKQNEQQETIMLEQMIAGFEGQAAKNPGFATKEQLDRVKKLK
jgi:hypothetical protein